MTVLLAARYGLKVREFHEWQVVRDRLGRFAKKPDLGLVEDIVGAVSIRVEKDGIRKDYVPGKWQLLTDTQRMQEVADRFKIDIEEARDFMPEDVVVELSNGPHRITVTTTEDIDLKKVAAALDYLIAIAPPRESIAGEGSHVTIKPASEVISTRTGKPVSGYAALGMASITLADNIWDRGPDEFGHSMPSIEKVPAWLYIMAHEWGHTQDSREGNGLPDGFAEARPGTFVSDYARTDVHEMWAEMWAEYHLSSGETTNKVAQLYAREFGWNEQLRNRLSILRDTAAMD